jgi:hypothetical protein
VTATESATDKCESYTKTRKHGKKHNVLFIRLRRDES